MKSHTAKMLFWTIFGTCLVELSLLTNRLTLGDGSHDHITLNKVVLPLDSLPELYTDEKLPSGSNKKSSKCYPLLGCIETLPLSKVPQDPETIYTEFVLEASDKKVIIEYEPTQICLAGSSNKCEIYPYDLSTMLISKYNPKNPTIFVTVGYFSQEMTSWQYKIREAWQKWTNANVILVRWPGGNRGFYKQAVANTKLVARQISVFLYYLAKLSNRSLIDKDFLSKVYLVGHSLGAHISGFVGQDMNGLIGRITALDPAGPEFIGVKSRHRLDKSDARLVDVIHTNGGELSTTHHYYGYESPLGHIDYYANNGKHQPGCAFGTDVIGCSHKLAPNYYAAILNHQVKSRNYFGEKDLMLNTLSAFRADNFQEFENGANLIKRCPKSALDEQSALSDLNNCTIPMDFFASSSEYLENLKQNYNIDLDKQWVNSDIVAYFYTTDTEPYVGHHSIVRAKVRSLASESSRIRCNLRFNLKLANGQQDKREVTDYFIISDTIVIPYLLFSLSYQLEFELLDNNDFFLRWLDTNRDQLSLGLKRSVAKSIQVSGLKLGRSGSDSPIIQKMKELFAIVNSVDTSVQCDYLIERIDTQPLKKMHRYMVVRYTAQAQSKDEVDVVVLKETEDIPLINIIESAPQISNTNSSSSPEVYIDTVYFGPRKELV